MIPCMGGFCGSRDRCANYYADAVIKPVERLCAEVEEVEPITLAMRSMVGRAIRGEWAGDLPADQGWKAGALAVLGSQFGNGKSEGVGA